MEKLREDVVRVNELLGEKSAQNHKLKNKIEKLQQQNTELSTNLNETKENLSQKIKDFSQLCETAIESKRLLVLQQKKIEELEKNKKIMQENYDKISVRASLNYEFLTPRYNNMKELIKEFSLPIESDSPSVIFIEKLATELRSAKIKFLANATKVEKSSSKKSLKKSPTTKIDNKNSLVNNNSEEHKAFI